MKTIKILAITLVVVVGLTCLAGCGIEDKVIGGMHDVIGNMQQQMQSQLSEREEEPDYEVAIDDFVSTSLNTFTIKVGSDHKPIAAVWVKGGTGHTYTSDSSVVTVSDGGKVTAIAEGSAYVVIAADRTMYEVYLYNVVA